MKHFSSILYSILLSTGTLTSVAQNYQAVNQNEVEEASILTLCDGTDTNKNVPFYFYYLDTKGTTGQVIYPESMLESMVGKQITGVTFYNQGYPNSWSIEQMGVSMATVDYATLPEDAENAAYIEADFTQTFCGAKSAEATDEAQELAFEFSTPFVYTGGNLVVELKAVTAGSSYPQVSFVGQNTEVHTSVYGYNSSRYYQKFLPKATFTFEELVAYKATVSEESLSFGTIFTGESKQLTFSISNTGANALTASLSGLENAAFAVETPTIEIPSGQTVTVPVTYAPTAAGTHSASLNINLGEAGGFTVALAGSAIVLPTGYQEHFQVEAKTLPEGWTGWNIKEAYSYDIYDYLYDSSFEDTSYFTRFTTPDNTDAIAILDDVNPFKEYPNQTYVYMVSPKVNGNIVISACSTTTSSYVDRFVKVYAATKNEDGTFTINTDAALNSEFAPELTADTWSTSIVSVSEPTHLAVLMSYASINLFAADEVETTNEDEGDTEEASILTLCDGTDTNKNVPFYFYYLDTKGTTGQVIYPESMLESMVGKQITGVTFYNQGYPNSWSIEQMGVSMATVDYATLPEDAENAAYIEADFTQTFCGAKSAEATDEAQELAFEFSTPFVYTGGNLVVELKAVTAGSSYPQVSFVGQNTEVHTSVYGYNSSRYYQKFLPKATFTFEELVAYKATVSEESLSFGTIFTGESKQLTFSISNTGANALTASLSGLENAAFAVETPTIEIPSGQTVTVPVTYAPTAAGTHSASLNINLGEAGGFTVALAGSAIVLPTGYQEHFQVEAKTLPEGWTGWNIKEAYSYDIYDYLYDSSFEDTSYFTRFTTPDNTDAIAILDDVNPFKEYPNQTYVYMVSPKVNGNIVISACSTTTSSYVDRFVKVYAATKNEDGTFTINTDAALNSEFAPELTADTWSTSIVSVSEPTHLAVLMSYAAINLFAADEVETITGITTLPALNSTVCKLQNGTLHLASTSELKSYQVYTLSGALIAQGALAGNNSQATVPAQRGVYLVKVTTAEGTQTVKVIAE